MRKINWVVCLALLAGFASSCRGKGEEGDWRTAREGMVKTAQAYGISDPGVLRALGKVRRHRYIPLEYRRFRDPYGNYPCPIGFSQTISQPYIVAYMTEKIKPRPGEKILEIGTGSGYQAAVLAELGAEVYSIEIVPELADWARKVLRQEGYKKVHVLTGDGWRGWPEKAPFDAIIVTCAPGKIPAALLDQLKEGGRMILPLGEGLQRLVIARKKEGRIVVENDLPVRFVPMVHAPK